MILIQLYIDDMKADMFQNVSVNIIDSIKDAQNIANVFTSYTQQFKLPASKQNNKIFKHFQNFSLVNGFDARRKHKALIKLNGADFQPGYVKLNEVELKDNKAHAYSIQFFGEMTTLKDQFGEDLLEDLSYLSRFDHEFSLAKVRGGFQTSLKYSAGFMPVASDTSGEIIYPFVTHTKGFQYTSSNGLYDITETGTPTSTDRLDYIDLKPALRVTEIFTAIEDKYDVVFDRSWIDSGPLSEMFIWCHKSKGGIVTDDITTNVTQWQGNIEDLTRNSFTPSSLDDPALVIDVFDQDDGLGNNDDWDKYVNFGSGAGACNNQFVSGANQRDILTYQIGGNHGQHTYYTGSVTVTPDGSFTADYNVVFYSETSGVTFAALYGVTGTQTVSFDTQNQSPGLHDLQFRVTSAELSEFNISLDITAKRDSFCTDELTRIWNYDKDVSSAELITIVKVAFNMPKMKVIDFMRSIFKMFNLVAYPRNPELYSSSVELVIEPLNDYYDNGIPRDITKYIDISSTSVERVTPFKTLKFEYEKPNTFLAKKTNELSRFEFGNLTFNQDNWGPGANNLLFDGGEYKVSAGFEKVVYERLKNGDNDNNTQLIYGWFVNDFKENIPEPELGKPLLFFLENRLCNTDSIEWEDGGVTNNLYNAAQNVNADGSQTINFGADNDEFTLEVNENSLFKTYYDRYISGVYDLTARRFKVSAYLPPEFILNYKLNDKIFINSVPFNIEKININMLTGKAQLELIKIVGYFETYQVGAGFCYAAEGYALYDYWCKEFQTVETPIAPEGLDFSDANNSQYIAPLLTIKS